MKAACAVVFVLAGLAGCIGDREPSERSTSPGPGETGSGRDPWPAVQAAMAGLPCDAPAPASGGATSNLRLLAKLALPDDEGMRAELDVRGPWALHSRYSQGGFDVYDLSDPLHPVRAGLFEEVDHALDVKFSPDGTAALVGVNDGIAVVDMRQPLYPILVSTWTWEDLPLGAHPVPSVAPNAHMLASRRIADQDWVFLAPNAGNGVWVFALRGEPGNQSLEYVTQTLPVEGGPLGPHDMYVHEDPLDGHWYLYSADGFHGWTAFNVDDPANPVLAGAWANPAEGSYTHTIQAAAVGGRRLVATIGEVGGNLLRIYDATVLAAPVLLAAWQAPGSVAAPQHNLNIAGDSLYMAHYGHGLYVFNLTDAFVAGLPVPGAGTVTLQPRAHWAVGGEDAGGPLSFVGFWDTFVQDGLVYVSHIEGGLIVLGYGCNRVPDPRLTSDG